MTDGIQQISDLELSRWIAERLEPFDALEESRACAKIAWKSTWAADGFGGHTWEYEPCDMVNDPAMTLMLLEKMAHHTQKHLKITATIIGKWIVEFGEGLSCNDKLGRAVAESFALAQGYPETLDRTTKEK